MIAVRLGSFGTTTPRLACLRELRGRDEMVLESQSPSAVTELVNRLLVDVPGAAVRPGDAWTMALSDRDRLVAALHASCFGDRVECVFDCSACGEPFEATFSLMGMLEAHEEKARSVDVAARGPDEAGYYTLEDGNRFRLPTANDERAVSHLTPEQGAVELLRRCRGGAVAGNADAAVQDAMAALAPCLDVDLQMACGVCGVSQRGRFDIVSFFAGALRREHGLLAREIHCLARAYHWHLDEILGLPRRLRREQVALVQGSGVRA